MVTVVKNLIYVFTEQFRLMGGPPSDSTGDSNPTLVPCVLSLLMVAVLVSVEKRRKIQHRQTVKSSPYFSESF